MRLSKMITSFPCFSMSTSVSMVFLFYDFINEQTILQCKTWQLQKFWFYDVYLKYTFLLKNTTV